MSVVYVLTTQMPEDEENATVEQIKKMSKWDNDDYVCRGIILNDKNPICTLRDYSKPSHEGYRNTIELLVGNNVVPLRSDTIQLVQNGCSFHGLRSDDPNHHLKDFLKLVDSLDLDGIIEGVLVKVAEHVYPVDFVILDIKENEKRLFILGTPFLTTAKAAIKFDKGPITLRSGKSEISFYRIPDSPCMTEKGVKNDIEPIAPTMTVNRLVLEWEEKIKLHLEREMKFNQ
uniref:MAK10-like protein n=1 Tax=Tanacetum cinerariifolium TaxID=118510 RepID=A0A6L2J472_TANCI|nr:MAK10-like protein [Tanacetum cinerariifolium]